MSEIIVKNNGSLNGEVSISGSKNSALPILASCVLCTGKSVLKNVPDLSDIRIMLQILKNLGAEVEKINDEIHINCDNISKYNTPYELVCKMRGSFLLAGSLLSKYKKAQISMPGGCPIGARPVDLHLKGFLEMGAEVVKEQGYINLFTNRLKGAKIYLDFPSVGATENLIMAATLADGETVIENAAAEPEIEDLANFLIKSGAKIYGAGSDKIKIIGVKEIFGTNHKIIPDRIEAGTFMSAIALTHGKGRINNVNPNHIVPMIAKLRQMGVKIKEEKNSIFLDARCDLVSTDIKTMPFPGFPTDMQAPFGCLLSVAKGTGVIVETVFENRFLHIAELKRMGANIKIEGRTSVVEGVKRLTGTSVSATDLRGGAALVIAGLGAEGQTRISNIEHINRGYENFVDKLKNMGADINISY